MPAFKRKRSFKGGFRRRFKRRYSFKGRRRMGGLRKRLSYKPPVYKFKRQTNSVYVDQDGAGGANVISVTQGAADSTIDIRFRLSDVAGAGDFTALYDQYRIRGVKLVMRPNYTEAALDAQTGVLVPPPQRLASIIDIDGSLSTITYSQMQEYNTFKWCDIFKPLVRFLRPRVGTYVYNGTDTLGALLPGKAWLDCAKPDVIHNGVLANIPLYNNSTAAVSWSFQVTYWLEFKNSK